MRRQAAALAGAAALCLLTGCAGLLHGRELQELQPVQTLGFDGAPGAVILSASDPGDGEQAPPVRLTARGPGVQAAAEALQTLAPREELFFAHVRFVLLGEAAARAGMGEVLDWFQRGTQTRLGLPVFVLRGGEARSLVDPPAEAEDVSARLAALVRQGELRGEVRCFTLLDTARGLARSGAALCCALERPGEGGELRAAGYAVIRNGALAGWLDQRESRGASLLLEQAGELCRELPDEQGGAVTVTLRSTEVRLAPRRADGGPFLDVVLSARAGVAGMTEPGPLPPERLSALETLLAEELRSDAEAALAASCRLDADFLELGRRFPRDGSFSLPGLRWTVRAEAEIERSYDIDGGPALRGEGAAG